VIPLAFVVAIAAATIVVLVVAAVSLAKQAARLSSTLVEFERDTRPIVEELKRDAERAAKRAEETRRAGERLRKRGAQATARPEAD
jgi:predicted Holliday junction resolvase-like endonuclease